MGSTNQWVDMDLNTFFVETVLFGFFPNKQFAIWPALVAAADLTQVFKDASDHSAYFDIVYIFIFQGRNLAKQVFNFFQRAQVKICFFQNF